MSEEISKAIFNIKEKSPCVQSISNIVTARDCANVLLAVYASPFMAHNVNEVSEVSAQVDALVVSMGATDDYEAISLAVSAANANNHPVVLDPVGVGASEYRREFCKKLIEENKISCIRGNASEIKALLYGKQTIKGLDSKCLDEDTNELCERAAKHFNSIVAITGIDDVISDGNETIVVNGGSALLKRITGAGCMLSCIVGAFLAANDCNVKTVSLACELMSECAAASQQIVMRDKSYGTMTFENNLIDSISAYIE